MLQHAVGYVTGQQYYGAKASMNVWSPMVANQYEFSLSQMWIISGTFGDDLNTIEAGWQACMSFTISSHCFQFHYIQTPFNIIFKFSKTIKNLR